MFFIGYFFSYKYVFFIFCPNSFQLINEECKIVEASLVENQKIEILCSFGSTENLSLPMMPRPSSSSSEKDLANNQQQQVDSVNV